MPPLPDVPEDATKAEQKLQPQLAIDPYPARFAAGGGRARIFGRGWCWRRAACFLATCSSAGCKSISNGSFRFGRGSLDIVLRRERQVAAPETMARLRSRKAEVDRSIESRRAATRFEPDAALPVDPNAIEAAEAKPTTPGTPPTATDQAGRRSGRRTITRRGC